MTDTTDLATSNALDEHAERIRQVLGVTADESAAQRRSIIRNAQATCAHCAKCGCTLAPEAPIWRQRMRLGPGFFGGHSDTVAPVCEQCRADWKEFRGAEPCENCGRPVHQQDGQRWHLRTFCCSTCERAVRVTAAREQRSDARGTRKCKTCGETFEPTRTDARYCTPACRQRAYRGRKAVTDHECVQLDAFASRNAKHPARLSDRELKAALHAFAQERERQQAARRGRPKSPTRAAEPPPALDGDGLTTTAKTATANTGALS
jgi:hypothetical protein